MHAPDAIDPVRGYRVWGFTRRGDDVLLQSTAAGFWAGMPVWEPYERFDARCLAPQPCTDGEDRGAPAIEHTCGIHAFSDYGDALSWARALARHRPVVIGAVSCWGRVVLAARGWRAQYAYPEMLDHVVASRRSRRRLARRPTADRGLLEELRQAYGIGGGGGLLRSA